MYSEYISTPNTVWSVESNLSCTFLERQESLINSETSNKCTLWSQTEALHGSYGTYIGAPGASWLCMMFELLATPGSLTWILSSPTQVPRDTVQVLFLQFPRRRSRVWWRNSFAGWSGVVSSMLWSSYSNSPYARLAVIIVRSDAGLDQLIADENWGSIREAKKLRILRNIR